MFQIPIARDVLLVLAVIAAAPVHAQSDAPARPRNVVFMIADGFGPASETLARAANGHPLALDGILTGSVSTASSDSRVTDSAAGATAYACGIKTYNGAIAVDADGVPCRTVLEAARAPVSRPDSSPRAASRTRPRRATPATSRAAR